MVQSLSKLVIETTKRANLKTRLFNTIVSLNTQYNGSTMICEGYTGSTRHLSGTFRVTKETKIKVYKGTARLFYELVIDIAVKYRILDHFFRTNRYRRIAKSMGISRTVLLHGPAGTGKSALCRAIAAKIAVRTKHTKTVEVHSAQYVSKFYGESAHKLNELFKSVDKHTVVIIDEVDSLIVSRDQICARNEPLDSMRIVNTFLVNLDVSGCFLMCTTNLLGVVDRAFVDRMDMVVRMYYPCEQHVHRMIVNALHVLMLKNVIRFEVLPDCYGPPSKRMLAVSRAIGTASARRIKKMLFCAMHRDVRTVDDILDRLERIIEEQRENEQL
ncbi:AAA+-type ATPase [Trachipleistophora hominis]|uniref:AAA+-type ATPase n=1 Tax=Trachipleistophora hominis TaxID=72359 RepID=L7JXF8_TRAHO|nr:AAA+-type ATPase [Trachipleistophora hominis]